MTRPVIITTPATLALSPVPIRPDWILSGSPQASAQEIARSRDGTAVTIVWACTPGAFRWWFGGDETVQILSGEVFVTDEHNAEHRLGPGDTAFFPAGTWSQWRVTEPLRKMAVIRHAMPRPLGFALRAFNRLVAIATGKTPAAMTPVAAEPPRSATHSA